MDTLQMYEIVNRLPQLKLHFQGIFATDTLPDRLTRFPAAIMCNTDPAEKRSTHWVAFWFKNMYECELYDSFGRRPEGCNEEIRTFIDNNSSICLYNNVQVQPYSAVTCGFHVLFYLYQRARSISLNVILTLLSKFPSDDFVRTYVLKNLI